MARGNSLLGMAKNIEHTNQKMCKRKKAPIAISKVQGSKKRTSKTAQKQIEAINNLKMPSKQIVDTVSNILEENKDAKLELITLLKIFLERKKISQNIEQNIPDQRDRELIKYKKQSIMMAALSIFLFRMGSGNTYDNLGHDNDNKYSRKNMAKFIDAPEDCVPVIKTIENFMKELEVSSINNMMIAFFKDLQLSKFFQQHPQILPGDFFLLAVDCVHTHTYNKPHHVDCNGNNDCCYCLKRVYFKGTANVKTRWLHSTLVYSFVFFGGLKIPVYQYPIHAKQVVNFENESEDNHKQECELVGLKMSLPIVREAFTKMKLVLLMDGLYANRPVIKLAEELNCGYIIVRKESCLTNLAKDCDEKSNHLNHKKNCTKKIKKTQGDLIIEQKCEWFNSMYLGSDLSTNVLRFTEITTVGEKTSQTYKGEWIFSWKLSAKNCELSSAQARARWEEEDIFNTLKNRGFNFKHDYSRHPRSGCNWHGVALFAFGIFELFRFSEAVQQRGELPQITLARKLEGQVFNRPTEDLFSPSLLLKKVQFRYNFSPNPIFSKTISLPMNIEESLKTGTDP